MFISNEVMHLPRICSIIISLRHVYVVMHKASFSEDENRVDAIE